MIVPNIPCGCYHQVRRREGAAVELRDCIVVKSRNRFPGTLDRTAEGMVGEVSRVEKFTQQFVGSIFDHLHLFKYHVLLAIQISLVEAGVCEEVGKQVKSFGQTS